jgi:hypothetical protein
MPRLLILTLDSGEAALPTLITQLAQQTFRDFEHEIISGLPNKAAHARLYRTIMSRAGSFDLFLKLDADMTLRSPTALDDAVGATAQHREAQHFAFPVWDLFTEEETLGVHIFRSGVSWGTIDDDLFVDPDPPGVRQIMWAGPPAPFVNHGEVVSDFECFSYGVHKFLKVAQRGRGTNGLPHKDHKFLRHLRNCVRVRELYRRTGARRHQFALKGIAWAMRHPELWSLSSKVSLHEIFEREVIEDEASTRAVDALSSSMLSWMVALVRSLGPRRVLSSYASAGLPRS